MMDKTAFTDAVLEAEPTLYRVAKAMLQSEADCADAAQQAILRAWEQLPSLRSARYFKTWLTRILINECTAILRRRQRLAPYEPALAAAIPAPAPDDHSDLYAALGTLEEKYRLPVVLYYWEGFKTREIARLLDLPEGTIKSRLSAARKLLRESLEGACFA
ncbi:sigma-70 family RNA polymerase sigma factor [Agathobaculum sp. NTUH-O15-33]|uniref:sigma-70 family RNA polymerase sigma factor n=1 Tax=Agathobaculum sp. NTUH-O15-33 TaxID=3079302 RepID=UPI0029589F11|nr:sigma-70 family RNA polymerase sigma factor [Agathobaculum sp. NTUH-O15-33]WNX85861.1 sigma-70 family RNA polymerase sigma factor [Agathobaculum sp. NTUH-O15-33]